MAVRCVFGEILATVTLTVILLKSSKWGSTLRWRLLFKRILFILSLSIVSHITCNKEQNVEWMIFVIFSTVNTKWISMYCIYIYIHGYVMRRVCVHIYRFNCMCPSLHHLDVSGSSRRESKTQRCCTYSILCFLSGFGMIWSYFLNHDGCMEGWYKGGKARP